jgi:hypothetical protein
MRLHRPDSPSKRRQEEALSGFSPEALAVFHEGGSEGVSRFGIESSGLDIPTRRSTFPIARTTGCIEVLSKFNVTLFLDLI